MRHRPSGQEGFTLVELIAALVIFSVAVVGTLEVFGVCLRSTVANVGHTRAVNLAQGLLEETIAEGYFIADTDDGDCAPEDPEYSWQREIVETETPKLYQIRIVVTWTERGRDKTFSLVTLAMDRWSL